MPVSIPVTAPAFFENRALASLARAGVEAHLFQDVQADPSEQIVLSCTEKACEQNCDGVVGVGGGSSLDVAKLAARLAAGNQPLAEAFGVGNTKGARAAHVSQHARALLPGNASDRRQHKRSDLRSSGRIRKQRLCPCPFLR